MATSINSFPIDLPVLTFREAPNSETTDSSTTDSGTSPANTVGFNLSELMQSKLYMQAISGGGKTHAIRALIEALYGQVQLFIFDPTGDFWTLRERFDVVLVGGKDADFSFDLNDVPALCQSFMALGVSVVFNMSELRLEQRRRFVRDFGEELLHLPRDPARRVLCIFDEVQIFAPEGASCTSTDTLINLALLGRNLGLSFVYATQRPSLFSKSVLAMCDNYMIGRTRLTADIARAVESIGLEAADRKRVRRLGRGEFFVDGEAFLCETPKLVKTGPVLTTHFRTGEHVPTAPPPPAEVRAKLEQLRSYLAEQRAKREQEDAEDLAEQAEEAEAQDLIVDLRREIAQLQFQLREAQDVPAAPPLEVLPSGLREQLSGIAQTLRLQGQAQERHGRDLIEQARTIVDALEESAPEYGSLKEEATGEEYEVDEEDLDDDLNARADADQDDDEDDTSDLPDDAGTSDTGAQQTLPDGQQRIVNTLAILHRMGLPQVDRATCAVLSKHSPRSSGYGAKLTTLFDAGIVDYPRRGSLELTTFGEEYALATTHVFTLAELHTGWYKRFTSPQGRLLRVLIKQYPSALTRDALAVATNTSPTSSGLGANIKALLDAGLVEYPRRSQVRATPLLFPKGLS